MHLMRERRVMLSCRLSDQTCGKSRRTLVRPRHEDIEGKLLLCLLWSCDTFRGRPIGHWQFELSAPRTRDQMPNLIVENKAAGGSRGDVPLVSGTPHPLPRLLTRELPFFAPPPLLRTTKVL